MYGTDLELIKTGESLTAQGNEDLAQLAAQAVKNLNIFDFIFDSTKAGGSEDAYDVESAYLSVFESAKDDRQAQLCDAMGIAVTGFSFDSLLDMCGCKHERPAPEKKEKKTKAR